MHNCSSRYVNDKNAGTLFWITGLAGAGKTVIGTALTKLIRENNNAVIHLDGDRLREIFGAETLHSNEDRVKLALRYGVLSKEITMQGVHVVCSTMSMFDVVRDKNRLNLPHYLEVFLDVPMDVLLQRDQKGLYSSALKNERENVQGVNSDFQPPKSPDIVLENDGNVSPEVCAQTIYSLFLDRFGK